MSAAPEPAPLWATCGQDRRDTEQRAEWTFHRGIPIQKEETPR